MAARPNTHRTLVYGVTLAKAQVARLDKAITQAENALATNALLTPDAVEGYKAYIKGCTVQKKLLDKLTGLVYEKVNLVGKKRKPGRPSKADIAKAAEARGETPAGEAQPKRRGRPPKAVSAAVAKSVTITDAAFLAAAPKRRGRPPKAKPAVVAAPVAAAETVALPKRRGRPPKAKPAAELSIAQQAAAIVAANQGKSAAQPARRGRPPKNKVVNGAGAHAVN